MEYRWAARPQILSSDSVPATTVAPTAITVIEDIVTSAVHDTGRASTEQILTDGCGLMCKRSLVYHQVITDKRPQPKSSLGGSGKNPHCVPMLAARASSRCGSAGPRASSPS